MSQPTLFLMLGYPGSGKTTASKEIAKLTGAVHLWADHERRLKFVNPTYGHQENMRLYDELNHKTKVLLESGRSVIFDTNFNYHKDREHLRKIAKECKANPVLIWVKAPENLARERATKDAHKQNTRVLGNLSEESFNRMVSILEPPKKNEPYFELDGTKISSAYIKDKLSNVT